MHKKLVRKWMAMVSIESSESKGLQICHQEHVNLEKQINSGVIVEKQSICASGWGVKSILKVGSGYEVMFYIICQGHQPSCEESFTGTHPEGKMQNLHWQSLTGGPNN